MPTQNTTQKQQLNIYQKLLEIQKKNLTFTKNATNPFFNSKYLTLDEINNKLNPILTELKLLVIHYTFNRQVNTKVINTETNDFDFIESSFPIPKEIIDPQKMGSAITYAKRYNLCQLFNIVSDEDDDGNATAKQTNQQNDVEEIAL